MKLDQGSLGSFGDLAIALGLLTPNGQPNASWFADPVNGGTSGTTHGLRYVLEDPDQRAALTRFVDQILGPPDARVREGATWVPLFQSPDPVVTVYAVVAAVGDEVHLGVGLDHTTQGGPPSVSTRVHVPVFRFPDRDHPLTGGGPTPDWLLLGRPGGEIEVAVDAILSATAPASEAASLGGVSLAVRIPTARTEVGFDLTLHDLQLPGAQHPDTFTLDATHPDQLGQSLLNLVAGLVRAQADSIDLTQPTLRPFAALAGMLGLRSVDGLPDFPIGELPTSGVHALVAWVDGVLRDGTARDAWLGQLAALVGGTVDTTRDAVVIPIGSATGVGKIAVAVGVRVSPGAGTHPVLVPWVEVSLVSRTGVVARAAADVLHLDTATGTCVAIPDARVEAVFGADAGGAKLVTNTPHLGVGSLHVGIATDNQRRPSFVLTAADVTVEGAQHDLVDLSTPDAALAAGADLVTGALTNALNALHGAGDLVSRLLGITATGAVSAITVPALVADPVGAVRGHWQTVLADDTAIGDLLGRLSALVRGAVAVTADGTGTEQDPWRVEVTDPVQLEAWREGSMLHVGMAAELDRPVLTDLTATTRLAFGLADLDFGAGQVTFGTGARLSAALRRTDGHPAAIDAGPLAVQGTEIAVEAVWQPGFGARIRLQSPDFALVVAGQPIQIPLPVIDEHGNLSLPTPDWTAIEQALVGLVGQVGLPEARAALDLLGWTGRGPYLSLSALFGSDLTAEIESWLANLLLDCDRIRVALGPVAALLSGTSLAAPLGSGNATDPFRCPIAGEPRAPGIRVWLDPGCAVPAETTVVPTGPLTGSTPPQPDTVAHVLRVAGERLRDVADLMVARDSLGQGMQLLVDRWQGTDGVVGKPGTLPSEVDALELPGLSYPELAALGRSGSLVPRVLGGATAAMVHIGTEAELLSDRPAGSTYDLSGSDPVPVLSAGAGPWFVRLPTPSAAATARPDRGGVGEQAARLVGLLRERAGDVVLVGYADAGAAAIRGAATLSQVTDVVTVGAPWASVSMLALSTGLGGDALQLLGRLQRPEIPDWPDPLLGGQCTPLQRLRLLVRRSGQSLGSGSQPPRADTETRRAGLHVHAIFGSLDADSLLRGLGAFAADAIDARTEQLPTTETSLPTALHVAVDVPVLDLDLGGLQVGAGAAFETCRLARSAADSGIDVTLARSLVVEVHLGVHDGWLVGGPGSDAASGDLRWLSARVEIPTDGTTGSSELVLHEARGLGVDKESWVVRADADTVTATGAVPEVRLLLGDVVARLQATSPHLAVLLGKLGLLSSTLGLDLDGLDRLLHDPAVTMRHLAAAAPTEIAGALRGLVSGATGSASTVAWTVGGGSLGFDLATGVLTAGLTTSVEGLLPVVVDMNAGPAATYGSIAVGRLDPDLGGVRLIGESKRDGQQTNVRVEWAAGGGGIGTIGLWPSLDAEPLTELISVAIPAAALQVLLSALLARASDAASTTLSAGLTASGLIETYQDGGNAVRLPLSFMRDPVAYLKAVTRTRSADLTQVGYDLLEALAHFVTDTPPGSGYWPITDGVELRYGRVGDALSITLHVDLDETLDGVSVKTGVDAGVVLAPDTLPAPALDLSVRVGDHGVQVRVDPTVRVDLLLPDPAAPLPIYPAGPGLGQAFGAIAASLVPDLLNRIAALGAGPAGLQKDVGNLVAELGDGLTLRDAGSFTTARVTAFAADPAGALLRQLPALLGDAAAAVATALNGATTRVQVTNVTGRATFGFGTRPGPVVSVTLDATGAEPAVDLAAEWAIPQVGTVRLDTLRLSASGVVVGADIGPIPVRAGPIVLRPLLAVRAGSNATSARLLSVGLALDDDAQQSVELRWSLDAQAPVLAAVDRDSQGVETSVSEPNAPARLLSVGVAMAGGVLLAQLPGSLLDARTIRILRGVLLTETATAPDLDPNLPLDLLDPDRLLHRLERLLWNAATDAQPLQLTIDDLVTIGLASTGGAADAMLGISLSLQNPGSRFPLAKGDTTVELEVDTSWLDQSVDPGLAVYAVHATRAADVYTFDLEPAVAIAGVGLRFTKESGPLLSLGPIGLDGVAVRVYGEAGPAGAGGGVQVELVGLAVAPSGAGGNNTVANGIMSDAGKSSPSQRPVFSPALAVQRHPTDDGFKVSIRAGEPPGPWWVVVQRQLGPLYIERLGFDEGETAGRVSRIALLFDGRVEIFGLTAAVDQLSIAWRGGDLLDITQWEVDLMGLAISADMSGVVLAGGLLKSVDGSGDNEVISYVGMLLGRFGIYGLTVFGGYANFDGAPSFFVFGAVNGPIGGPPAFFITGLGGGLGINRKLVIPDDPRQFPTYPFIQALDPYAAASDPMTELHRLNDYFGPQLGTFWFAAGISFTCFSLVDGVAVVAVAFGNGLEIDLMGVARMALPNPAAALVSIELGLLARFSTVEGVFMIRAALTDNSWLLYQDVRLTGGFAFATWWKGPLSGEFVLTIGGYHPDFHVDGYPDVPRVGLTWQVTDDIVVKGGCYFALTSEAIMAGVGIQVVADFGWAWARVNFSADGLVYFDPFWYDVSIQATISAGISIDTWFGTISLSITTGSGVHVWGPDFSGEATVEVGPCSVTVPFGSNAQREGQVLDWAQFVAKYLEDAGGGAARALSGITGKGSLPASTDGGRSAPTPDGTFDHPFEVFAEFEMTLVTTVPATSVDLEAHVVPVSIVRSNGAGSTLGLTPMKVTVAGSTLQVRLEKYDAKGKSWSVDSEDLAQLGSAVGTSSFPLGVWSAPQNMLLDTKQVPTALPSGDVVYAGSQVTLTALAAKQAVGPQIDYYKVEAGRRPLPLSAQQNQRLTLAGLAASVPLPAVLDTDAAVTAAEALLFSPRKAAPAGSALQANGIRSGVARAGYRGDIAAPPLFGSLADGLAVENGATAPSAPADPPQPTAPPPPQDPRVVAFLAAGSGVAPRRPGTTVADAETKRRTAPTLESVQSRLGRHLPLSLDVSLPPGGMVRDTFSPSAMPFSRVPSSARSYGLGDPAAASRVSGITGRGGPAPKGVRASRTAGVVAKDAHDEVAALASGDVVVLQSPDHGIDTSPRRPRLEIGGTGRVTFLRGDGFVLGDSVETGVVTVPQGTAVAAIQADGTLDTADGCAGWHTRSRVAALGPSAALAACAVLVVDAGRTPVEAGWTTAGEVVRDAARVLTRFSVPVRTVALVVETDAPDRFGDMGLELRGATRTVAADGNPTEARLLMTGVQAVAVYDVVPDRAAEAVGVSVATGGDWRLTGVLGSELSADELARVLLRDGLVGATARIGAVAGAGCSPVWGASPGSTSGPPKRAPTKKNAKNAPAKRTVAKKSPAPKVTAKKSPAPKVTAKKSPAPKVTAKKATAPKVIAKKATARRVTTRKTTTRKTTAHKSAAPKAAARTESGRRPRRGR